LHRLPAATAGDRDRTLSEFRLALVRLHRAADPDVHLAVASGRRLPRQCRSRGCRHHRRHAADERHRHPHALQHPQEDQVAINARERHTQEYYLGIKHMVTATTPLKAESRDLNFIYNGGHHALKGINMPLYEKKITALIGPSGCGKSTYLRC